MSRSGIVLKVMLGKIKVRKGPPMVAHPPKGKAVCPRSGSLILCSVRTVIAFTKEASLLVNLDVCAELDISHGLRRDENELTTHGTACSSDHHSPTNVAIDVIHEDVELVQASDGRTHRFPDGEQEADGRK